MSDAQLIDVGQKAHDCDILAAAAIAQFYTFADRCMDWANTTRSFQERALYRQMALMACCRGETTNVRAVQESWRFRARASEGGCLTRSRRDLLAYYRNFHRIRTETSMTPPTYEHHTGSGVRRRRSERMTFVAALGVNLIQPTSSISLKGCAIRSCGRSVVLSILSIPNQRQQTKAPLKHGPFFCLCTANNLACRMAETGHSRQMQPVCLPVHVRFGPKAIYIRRCREMTRCAKHRQTFDHFTGLVCSLMTNSCLYHYFHTGTGWAVLFFAVNAMDAGRGVARLC